MRRNVESPRIPGPLPYRRGFGVVVHALIVVGSYAAAFLLRFEFSVPPRHLEAMLATLPFLLIVRLLAFGRFHLYAAIWRFVGLQDLIAIVKAVSLSSAVFAAGVLGIYGYGFGRGYARSVLVLDWVLCVASVTGIRVGARWIRERRRSPRERRRAVIVGAGEAGEMLVRNLERAPLVTYEAVAFVDDDLSHAGRRIHGIPVLGTLDRLPQVVLDHHADEILLAIPSVRGDQRRRVLSYCLEAAVPVRTVPSLGELLEGNASIAQLQAITPEDLLPRQPVEVEIERVAATVAERCVVVTGAGGSIGSELSTQIAALQPTKLILLERAETALFHAEMHVREIAPELDVVPVVGDILDRRLLNDVFGRHKPDLVYHAAAYKHVPLMEANPLAALENNIFGTESLARTSLSWGVNKFVLISTDKAVSPVGIMGMTKRVAEDFLRSLEGGGTTFCTVRFGNVLGSVGSVLPLFQSQIASRGAVTITDPEAQRYFMLIAEAAQLVLQASAMARGNEIFFLDMGQPVKIKQLAESLIRLAGGIPGQDVILETIGLRPGERLTEELTRGGETYGSTGHDQIVVLAAPSLDVEQWRMDFEELRALVADRRADEAVVQLRMMAGAY